jgi:DNA-binding winged helix-turn-helix (wHTH) protein/predicted ATPase
MESAQQLVFGPFRLDPINNRLWRRDQPIELKPRPLAVLRYLAERPGQVVTKEELLEQVWAGIYVTKTVLKVSIHAIRAALEEDANAPVYIETVGREGYRFRSEESKTNAARTEQKQDQRLIVGRTREVQQLQAWLRQSVTNERQIVFVTGAPGIGKTTMIDLFLEQVRTRSEAWIGRGQCLEQYGEGEAYLPVLEALGQLCRGPGGKQALAVLQRYAPTWLVQLPSLVGEAELDALQRKVAGATRGRMLREMAEALEALTAERGLVLVVEDLHVSDYSTVELIAYLAQRRGKAKLLVIGTYRPTDVILRNHPIKGIKQELSATGRCSELRVELLSRTDVEEYIAQRLAIETVPAELTGLIHQRTDGNALFMVNVVEYCLRQGLLMQEEGLWKLKEDSEKLGVPESVQQLIAKQAERLTENERQILELASVVGNEFAVASLTAVLQSELDTLEETCEELTRKSHFLQEAGVTEWPDGTLSGRYTFRHVLYQNVLYERIAAARRVRLHRMIGERQEQAYGMRAKEVAAELAMHFERGRDYLKAVSYLHKAGTNAIRRSAHREAIRYLSRGLELLELLPKNTERDHQEISLQLTLGLPLAATKGYAAPEVEQAYTRALVLCGQIGETPLLFPALVGLWAFQLVRGQLPSALGVASQGLRLAEQARNPSFLLEAHLGLGMISEFRGELNVARGHLEEGIALASNLDRAGRVPTSVQDSEVGCLTYTASTLWHLGYTDQARRRADEALALARRLAHPFSEAFALSQGAGLHLLCGDIPTFRQWINEAMTLAQAQGFPLWIGLGTAMNGWALIEQGQTREGMAQVRQGLALYQTIGMELSKSFFLLLLADAHGRTGQTDEGLALLTQAQEFMDTTGEHLYEAELYRLKGELTLQQVASGKSKEERRTAKAKSNK